MAVEITANSTDRVSYGDIARIAGLTGISIAITVKLTATPVAEDTWVQQWGPTPSTNETFLLGAQGAGDEVGFITGGGSAAERYGLRTTGVNLVNGGLYRVLATWGPTDTVFIWVNGVNEATETWLDGATPFSALLDSPEAVEVGYSSVTGTSAWTPGGQFSEFAIWDHVVPAWVARKYGLGHSPEMYTKGGIIYDPLYRGDFPSRNLWGKREVGARTGTKTAPHPNMVSTDDSLIVLVPPYATISGSVVPTVTEALVQAGV